MSTKNVVDESVVTLEPATRHYADGCADIRVGKTDETLQVILAWIESYLSRITSPLFSDHKYYADQHFTGQHFQAELDPVPSRHQEKGPRSWH